MKQRSEFKFEVGDRIKTLLIEDRYYGQGIKSKRMAKRYKCVCVKCGNKTEDKMEQLLIENCGCLPCSNNDKKGKQKPQKNDFLYEVGMVLPQNLEIINRAYTRKETEKYNTKKYDCKCIKCGYIKTMVAEYELKSGRGCSVCAGRVVVEHINSIVANEETHWMVDYFPGGWNEAKLYTYSSNKKVEMKCPVCGKKKAVHINNLYRTKNIGCDCSSTKSYPEKIMIGILKQLNIHYVFDRVTPWSEGRRYDFYIPSLSMIIETHGIQHYEQTNRMGARTLKEEQENDKYKRELALANGIKHYIEIDCRYSVITYVKNSISSSLGNIIEGFESLDWGEIEKATMTETTQSEVERYCEFYNNNCETMRFNDMADELGINAVRLRKMLLKGAEMGLTSYTTSRLRRIKAINKETGEITEFEGIIKAAEALKINQKAIGSVLSPSSRSKSTGGYYFEYC